jgi:putrescine transport system substrate-binding protein
MTGHSGTDVAVPSSNFLEPLIAAGALQKLDKTKLPNWKHLDPAWLARLARMDPGNEYGVPYLWGIHAFGYEVDRVTAALGHAPPQSWRMIFDPEIARRLEPCGIAWQDSAGSIMTKLALLGIGLDPTSEKPEDLDAAEAAFMRVRPYVRYIDSTDRTRTELASGELCIAIAPNGEVLTARDVAREARTNVNLRFVVPEEGALLWADLLVIPANAPHPDAAHRFIDFMLRPDVIAKVTDDSKYANANREGTQRVTPAVRDDPDVYPSPETMRRLHLLPADTPQYARARTRMWTRVRTSPSSDRTRTGS